MGMRMRFCLVSCLLLTCAFLLLPGVSGQRQPSTRTRVFTDGRYKVAMTFKTISVREDALEDWWGGGWEEPKLEVIDSVRISRGKEKIYVPVSAFSGMSKVREVAVRDRRGKCYIFISGADAGASYHAEIVVKGTGVAARTVRGGAFPEERWEKTQYAYVPDDCR